MRNVEFKARDDDPAASRAAALAAGAAPAGVLHQVDTYFSAPSGRLKLREQEPGGEAWLIPYTRADAAEARVSDYVLVAVDAPASLKAALTAALGVDVVVDKRRELLLLDDVRIHLDDVAGLGRFVEVEAVVDADDEGAGHARVEALREALGVSPDAIVAEGYAQLVARASADAELVAAAAAVARRAYAPYSRFAVGAALRGDDGAIYAAANVENAAYPQGQCAEASALGVLVAGGAKRVTEVAVYADAELITPCGGCRQRLREFASDDVKVHLCGPEGVGRTVTLGQLLPLSFTEGDMA